MTVGEFFRKFGAKISKSLLNIFIMLAISTYVFSTVTSPSFLSPLLTNLISQQFESQDIGGAYEGFLMQCQLSKTGTIDLPLEGLGDPVSISCAELKAGGPDGLLKIFSEKVTASIFSSSLNPDICSGPDCLQVAIKSQDPLEKFSAIMNPGFNQYMKDLSFKMIVGAIICAVLIFILVEGWPSKLFGLGVPLAMAGVPYLFMDSLKNKLSDMLPQSALLTLNATIMQLSNAFLMLLTTGVVLILGGFVLKIWLKKKGSDEEFEELPSKPSKNSKKKK